AVDIVLASLLLVGGAIGAQIGARLAMKVNPARMRLGLAIVVILVALRMAIGLAWQPEEIFTIQWL
ncbi:MAG: sulfite exporter TauE/SafE family protein, partial [Sphingopyxis sp.]